MLICLEEFVIQKYFPLGMDDLTSTMSHKHFTRLIVWPKIFGGKILESIWQLSNTMSLQDEVDDGNCAYGLKIGNMFAQVTRWFAPAIFRFISKVQIRRPEFGTAERCQVGGVGPHHQSHNNSR